MSSVLPSGTVILNAVKDLQVNLEIPRYARNDKALGKTDQVSSCLNSCVVSQKDLEIAQEEVAIQKWGVEKTRSGMKVLVIELVKKSK